jgi:hypothetical protein
MSGLPVSETWASGSPRDDLVLAATQCLPEDLQSQERRLVTELDGRDLVLVTAEYDVGGQRSRGSFLDTTTAGLLHDLCARRGVVLGYHEDRRDRARGIASRLVADTAIDLHRVGIPEGAVVDRVARFLVTDHAARAMDFAATGKDVLLVVGDREDPGLTHDLVGMFPSLVLDRSSRLVPTLDALLSDAAAEQDAAVDTRHSLFFEHQDGRSAERLVRRLRLDALERGHPERTPFPG